VFESKIDWMKALKSAAGGGVAGALAMIIQVLTLMPLRTVSEISQWEKEGEERADSTRFGF